MDHLFDCVFRCEDRHARWLSVDLGKAIPVVPELAGFSHTGSDSVLTATRPPQVYPQQRKRESTGGTAVVWQKPTSCRAVVAPA